MSCANLLFLLAAWGGFDGKCLEPDWLTLVCGQSISQPQSAAAEHEHDEQIARLVSEVETRKRRRDFMASLAERPLPFLHDVVCALALDLATVRSEGSSR